MKVLFDANVPAKLRNHLPGHEVTRAQTRGWQELKNGALLDAAERAGFDVMVTGDKNLSYQQISKTCRAANSPWSCCRQSTGASFDKTRPRSLLRWIGPHREASKRYRRRVNLARKPESSST